MYEDTGNGSRDHDFDITREGSRTSCCRVILYPPLTNITGEGSRTSMYYSDDRVILYPPLTMDITGEGSRTSMYYTRIGLYYTPP